MDKTPVSIMANIKSMCPTFSIIIPHYDIPDLLMRCLKSIPVSEDIQVIVVDDNSPDDGCCLQMQMTSLWAICMILLIRM